MFTSRSYLVFLWAPIADHAAFRSLDKLAKIEIYEHAVRRAAECWGAFYSYYFTFERARTVADVQANPKAALGFTSEGEIFSDAIYVAVEGRAELIQDKEIFKAHWTSDLDRWFANGVDTPNVVLIKVKATRITCWDGEDEAEVIV
jgi:general stress protein 26